MSEGAAPAFAPYLHGARSRTAGAPRLTLGLRDWETGFGAAVIGPTESGIGIVRPGAGGGTHFEGIHNRNRMYVPGQSADPLDVYGLESELDGVVQ